MFRAALHTLPGYQRVAKVHPDVTRQAGWLWDIFYSLDDEK
jgi:hypothetical protein